MVELRKSFGPDDRFFRFPPSKKQIKENKWDLDILGKYANGECWRKRTGSHAVRRIHRSCKKYLKEGLETREDPCKFLTQNMGKWCLMINFSKTSFQMASLLEYELLADECDFVL